MTDTTRPEWTKNTAQNFVREIEIRAQIAVLEILVERWSIRSCSCGIEVERKIADLRKELGA